MRCGSVTSAWHPSSHVWVHQDPNVWNKTDAEERLLLTLGVGRLERRNPKVRAQILNRLLPQAVAWSMEQYEGFAPSRLRPYIKEVLAVSYPLGGSINAWATTRSPTARVVNLTPEFLASMKLIAVAYSELTPQVLDLLVPILAAEDKKILPPLDAMNLLAKYAESWSGTLVITPIVKSAAQALAEVRRNPASAPTSLANLRNLHRLGHDDRDLLLAGVFFVVGHELGHHLLNHGASFTQDNSAPGNTSLNSWLNEIQSEIPASPKRSHGQEHEADAMAVLLGSRLGDLGAMLVSSGAFLSTLCFSLVGEARAGDMAGQSKTHPSFIKRSLFLFELMSLTFGPLEDVEMHGDLGRHADRHPSGFSLQVWLVCQVIANLVDAIEGQPNVTSAADERKGNVGIETLGEARV